MKKCFFLVFTILVAFAGNAQRPGRNFVKIDYFRFADDPLPKWAKTFAVRVESSSRHVMIGGPEKRSLALKGFDEAPEFQDSDVQITFEIHGVSLSSDIVMESREVKKDEETITVYTYFYVVIAKPSGIYFINLSDGSEITTTNFRGDQYKYTQKSEGFTSRSAATKAYNSSKESILEEASRNSVKNVVQSLGRSSNDRYGYYYYTVPETIISGKGRKFDYSDLDDLYSSYTEAVNLYNSNKLDEYITRANDCIEGWEEILTQYNPHDKKAMKKGRINFKIASRLYYNIGIAYLYMNEFKLASENTEKGLAIDRSFQGKSLLSNIAKKRVRYEKNQKRENGNG